MVTQIARPVAISLATTVAKSFLWMLIPEHISHPSSAQVEQAFTTAEANFLFEPQVPVNITLLQVESTSRNQEFQLECFSEVDLSDFS